MAVLSSKKILQENNASDPSSITSLSLSHKALSDVSCLSEFKNLERLDLRFNNLTSLEGLKSCSNLKWLSVVQNKLVSLKGIEGLTNLTVLNAGKNNLKSMDEVQSLSNLRALILNDNEISSVCKLDQMKDLNTLVLSRNPISSLGDSVIKLKSLTKLSVSNCQLQNISAHLKSFQELKELRLAHNEIMTIPSEFGQLVKLQNLDIGNNLITNWSNLKVLSSLVNLRNLNLLGNPIAEKEKLQKKVKKLLPNLHTFNAKPIDKITGKEVHEKVDFAEAANKFALRETNTDHSQKNKKRKESLVGESVDNLKDGNSAKDTDISEKRTKKKLKLQQNDSGMSNTENNDVKSNELAKEPDMKLDNVASGREHDKETWKKKKGEKANTIDTADYPVTYLSGEDASEDPMEIVNKKSDHRTNRDIDAVGGSVAIQTKKKKKNCVVDPALIGLSQVDEIGLGGPSAWGD